MASPGLIPGGCNPRTQVYRLLHLNHSPCESDVSSSSFPPGNLLLWTLALSPTRSDYCSLCCNFSACLRCFFRTNHLGAAVSPSTCSSFPSCRPLLLPFITTALCLWRDVTYNVWIPLDAADGFLVIVPVTGRLLSSPLIQHIVKA